MEKMKGDRLSRGRMSTGVDMMISNLEGGLSNEDITIEIVPRADLDNVVVLGVSEESLIERDSELSDAPTMDKYSGNMVAVTAAANQRLDFIDIARGVIMCIMSLDHTNTFVHCNHTPATESVWSRKHALDVLPLAAFYKSDWGEFFTRHVTHICAPGFVFLMGLSMSIVFNSRIKKRGWNYCQVVIFFLKRAVICFIVTECLELGGWIIGWAGSWSKMRDDGWKESPLNVRYDEDMNKRVPMSVIFGLFTCMFFVAPLMGFIRWWVEKKSLSIAKANALAGFLISTFCCIMAELRPPDNAYVLDRTYRVFVSGGPNRDSPSWGPNIVCKYPIMPMMGACLFGASFGDYVLARERSTRLSWRVMFLGFGGLVAFFVMRGFVEPDNRITNDGGIAFMSLTKYPFSFCYLSWNLGWFMIVLFISDRISNRGQKGGVRGSICNYFILIGRVPLFYYVLHLYVFGVSSLPFSMTGYCGELWMVYVIVIVGNLTVLRWSCNWFWEYKQSKDKDSLIRMF